MHKMKGGVEGEIQQLGIEMIYRDKRIKNYPSCKALTGKINPSTGRKKIRQAFATFK